MIDENGRLIETFDEPGKKPSRRITCVATGVVVQEEWWWKHLGGYHRLDGPASVRRKETGELISERWFMNGDLHREDGPAVVEYGEYPGSYSEDWYRKGRWHRVGGPAMLIVVKGVPFMEHYYQDGFPHRLDGPAVITRHFDTKIVTTEGWHVWGLSYRTDGGPTSTIRHHITGEIERQLFESEETEPTRAEALRRRLNFMSRVIWVEPKP
ncbi:MAG: hypothetical protein WDM81_19520 [Rhizomicrobium sp.]